MPTQQELKQQGNSHFQKKEFEKAIQLYTLAIEEDTFSDEIAPILSNRSLCYYNIKKYDEALQDAQKTISLRPTWPRGYQRAGAACEKLEKYEEGLKHLDKCFELDEQSRNDPILKELKHKLTTAAFEQKLSSMNQQELKQEGNIHFQNDDFEKAIEFYTLAIEKDAFCDEAAPILSNRSLCYYNIGKYKEAYEDAGCCCGIRPDWAKGFARRGAAAEELKEWQIALESYDEYLKLDKSDEMDIKSKQRNVKKIVDAIEKKEQEREKELRKIDEILSAMIDGTEEKQIQVYRMVDDACLQMDIQKIEFGVKQGADLSRPFFSDRRKSPRSVHQAFSNANFLEAEKMMKRHPDSRGGIELTNLAGTAVTQLGFSRSKIEDSQFAQNALLSKHRDFLDRLIHLVDKQKKAYVPIQELLKMGLELIMSGGNRCPFRTDLFLLLNTESGRNFFEGDGITMKQWRLKLVQTMLYLGMSLNMDPKAMMQEMSKKPLSPTDFDICPTGLHLRRILECLEIGLSGMSVDDLNSKVSVEDREADRPGVYIERSLLETSVIFAPAAEILEFLLSRGANPNFEANVDDSLVDLCFFQRRHACARVLLSYGANLVTESLPAWILEHPLYSSLRSSSSSASSSMFFPQALCYKFVHSVFTTSSEDSIRFREDITEDFVRLLFDTMTEQNISFINYSAELDSVFTPLTLALTYELPLEIIEMIVKVRPKLLKTPIPSSHLSANGKTSQLIYPPLILFSTLRKASSIHYQKAVMKMFFDTTAECSAYTLPCFQEEMNMITVSQYSMGRLVSEDALAREFGKFCLNFKKEKK